MVNEPSTAGQGQAYSVSFGPTPYGLGREERHMVSKRTGIIIAIVAAAILSTLLVHALGIGGE